MVGQYQLGILLGSRKSIEATNGGLCFSQSAIGDDPMPEDFLVRLLFQIVFVEGYGLEGKSHLLKLMVVDFKCLRY